MSGAESFFDTSVLLYLLSAEAEKADRVETLLTESGVISVQVLNEFTGVACRKLAMPLADIREILETVRNVCRTEPLTVEDHDRAVQVVECYKFSFYDSVIVASALRADCKILYTEDLQHRQVIEGQLTVTNPFARG
jgi:predicted nucleic acid-binding protein